MVEAKVCAEIVWSGAEGVVVSGVEDSRRLERVSLRDFGGCRRAYTLPQMPAFVASTKMLGPIRRGPKAVILSMTSVHISF
jgi:hypothetical protein